MLEAEAENCFVEILLCTASRASTRPGLHRFVRFDVCGWRCVRARNRPCFLMGPSDRIEEILKPAYTSVVL